jgi:hypothetical protein
LKKYCTYIIVLVFFVKAYGQNLGGSATYNFLKLPQSSTISALGGTVVALNQSNLSIAQQNPAMLQPSMHNQLHTSMQFLYGGIKNMNVSFALHQQQKKITVAGAIQYVNYGTNTLNNASGNNLGNFSANDYALQISASKQYLQKWQYGTTVKLIASNYGSIQSYAIAMDAGISYSDTAKLLKAGLVFKNVGAQLKAYTGTTNEALPFDLQLGLSKKLKNAPIQFVATITNAHQFDIRYADTTFDNDINNSLGKNKFTIDKLFRHLIIATQIYPSKNLELTVSYNYLRRKELGLYNIGNGINGFSFGASMLLKAYQLSIAQAYFQNNKPYYQVGIAIDFKNLHN